jgi:carboxylate-amine ligase
MIVACVAQAARDIDAGVPFEQLPRRMIEENMWRAVRHGLDGDLLDLVKREAYPAGEAIDRLLGWTAPVRSELGIEPSFPERNGAQRQRQMIDAGMAMEDVYAAVVAETCETYSGVPEMCKR